jgi:serine/threonine protein kinase
MDIKLAMRVNNDKWKGVKVLGIGGYGIVGLFEKTIDGEKRKVVVKQSNDTNEPNAFLKAEAQLLINEIRERGAEHVIRILANYVRMKGRDTNKYDPKNKMLGTVYLEFCDLGDMMDFIKRMYEFYSAKDPLPEATIWRVWECLAKALNILESEREERTGEKWDKDPIVHFDIKPENSKLCPWS